MERVDPNLCLPANALGAGGTTVDIIGKGFVDTNDVTIGDKPLLSQRFVSATRITGRTPNLAPGIYSVKLIGLRGIVLDTLDRAVEVAAAATLTSVDPSSLSREGGTPVVVRGTNLKPATLIKFGAHALLNPVAARDGRSISGEAPPLDAGEPDGPYAVTAEDGRGRVTLNNGVTYFTPVVLTDVQPNLVSTFGGTVVTFIGSGFKPTFIPRLGGTSLTEVAFVDSEHIRGKSPVLAAGLHEAQILIAGATVVVAARLPDAVLAAAPAQIVSVDPEDVSGDSGTPVTIIGKGFRPVTKAMFGRNEVLDIKVLDPGTMTGRTPPLSAGEALGLKDVTVFDSRGNDILENGVNYVAPPAVTLLSVDPNFVSTLGGIQVVFVGSGFKNGDVPQVGGLPLTEASFVDAAHLRGKTPALTEGIHEARVLRGGAVVARLPRGVQASAPPVLRGISPPEVSTLGGTPVTITGAGFRPETVFKLGALLLESPVLNENGSSVSGFAPAQAAGPKDVTAEDVRGTDVLRNGVTYVTPESPTIPPPQGIETALAYQRARFTWENPVPYTQIQVLDSNDVVVDTLPGDATNYEREAGGAAQVVRKFKGLKATLKSDAAVAVATKHQCVVPPPLTGLAEPGELVFTLYGAHSQVNDDACADPEGGGGALVEFEHAQNGIVQTAGSKGYMVQDVMKAEIVDKPFFKFLDSNKLTTGFTLEEDADKLEIAAYYRKTAGAFGLQLRGRLIHVFPDDGFADEFTFPDTLIKEEMEWHSTTYFRSFLDGDGVEQPCLDGGGKLKKIPAGEYLLDLYAVGGSRKLPYFQFADDPLDLELFIKGSPCPPYPMVRVTDLTGLRTVPDIKCIVNEIVYSPGDVFDLTVKLKAQGSWIDFDNTPYRVHPTQALCADCCGITFNMALKNSVDFEYTWSILEEDDVPITKFSGNSPELWYLPPDWGCYKVELTVRDKKCKLERKFSQEVAIVPTSIVCNDSTLNSSTCKSPQVQMKSAFMFPTPKPGNISAVIGLRDANVAEPGRGSFDGERPVQFRVLVVPCHCGPSNIFSCPSPTLNSADPNDDDIEFRLAIKDGSTYTKVQGAQIDVLDLCDNIFVGPKYLMVTIKDMGKIPYQAALGQYTFKSVYFQARNRYLFNKTGQGDSAACWRNIGSPIRLSNRPDSFTTSYWSGYFEPRDASYHFVSKSSKNTEENFDLGASKEMPIEIPDVDTGVPSYENNNVTSGFTSRFMAMNNIWLPESGVGGMSGDTLGNNLQGEPLAVSPSVIPGGGGFPGGGLVPSEPPSYEWCKKVEIFKNKFSQTLFEAVIYTGTIGPVPVTVWASVGLGIDILIEAYAYVKVSPFEVLSGGEYVSAYFDLLSEIKISIPCEVRADILAGLASIAMRLRPEATFTLIPYLTLSNTNVGTNYYMEALFSLYFEIEVCIQTIIFGEQCFSPGEVALIDHEEIFSTHGTKPSRPGNCASEGGDALAAVFGQGQGEGGGVIDIHAYTVAVAPVTIISPDKKTIMDIWVRETDGALAQVRANTVPIKAAALPGFFYYLIDPSAAFVANDKVIIAWTRPANQLPPGALPTDTNDPLYLPTINANTGKSEIQIAAVRRVGGDGGNWLLFDHQPHDLNLMDALGPPTADWRPDGRASVSGDLADEEAMVAWVRYDTPDFMIKDGTKLANVPCPEGEICLCHPGPDAKPCAFTKKSVPNFRPQMEKASIYARRVGMITYTGPGNVPLADAQARSQAFKISPPGINIEPAISVSPSGAVAYCAWVHDPTHKNLIDSNRGRHLLYAVYTKNAANLDDPNQWSAPQDVVAIPDDFPGILEPRIMLNGDHEGLLVFTALAKTATTRDTGLGAGRYLFGSRLVGGVFGEPFKVHGKCFKREYGYEQGFHYDIPDLIDPKHILHWRDPEWVMGYQGLGEVGLPEGSGNVMVTVLNPGETKWSPPINLTPDSRVHTNVATTMGPNGLHSIHLDGGPSTFNAGGGGIPGGILSGKTDFVVMDTPLEPDPAIVGCRLDDPYPPPGSFVKATVEIENAGLRGTPVFESDGTSALTVRAILVEENGREIELPPATVPELMPGETARVVLDIEMPLDPVLLRVQLDPGPIDSNPLNNSFQCYFGAPAPTEFHCQAIPYVATDEEGVETPTLAVLLTWTTPVVYDEVLLYRDGALLTALPGTSKTWVDPDTNSGDHVYGLRGRIGVSRSIRTTCALTVEPPTTAGIRRGDVDGNGVLDITDGINLLGYLFLCPAPCPPHPCPDAGDTDDNGSLEITDAINILGYLFQGGRDPAPPGPHTCAPDLTADGLPECERACK